MASFYDRPQVTKRALKKQLSKLSQNELRELIGVLQSITSGRKKVPNSSTPCLSWYLDFEEHHVTSKWFNKEWFFLLEPGVPLRVIKMAVEMLKDYSVPTQDSQIVAMLRQGEAPRKIATELGIDVYVINSYQEMLNNDQLNDDLTIWQICEYVEALGHYRRDSTSLYLTYIDFSHWLEDMTKSKAEAFEDYCKDGIVNVQGPERVHSIKASTDSTLGEIFQEYISQLEADLWAWGDKKLKEMIIQFVKQEQAMRFVKQD